MIRLITITVIAGMFSMQANAQDTLTLPRLKFLIDSLYGADQQVQNDFINAYQRGVSMDSLQIYERLKNETFIRHTSIIKQIVTEYGYPNIQQVGRESVINFFPLIQHADNDPDFQEQMLPLIRNQVKKGLLNGWEYAFLYDRIKINGGKKQLYGTQLTYNSNQEAIPKKIRYKKGVNNRRSSMGMEPLEEYLEMATQIHKSMNTKE